MASALFTVLVWVFWAHVAADAEDPSCTPDVLLLQKGLHVHDRTQHLQRESKPWDTHLYFVGTHHKAGSQLLRNTMKWAFDYLGANYSCQEHLFQHATITTVGGENKCSLSPDCRIHWDNSVSLESLERNRQLAGSDGLKLAHSVRDPKVMLASSYCYHHRGEEYGNPIAPWPEIMVMGPFEGMFAVLPGMLELYKNMAEIYNHSYGDVFNSRYEIFTESSESFDAHVAELYDFMFGDLISAEDHKQIRKLAQQEDLNRGENGLSAGNNHSNSEDCESDALAVLEKTPGLYEPIQEFRQVLGYS